MIHMKYRMTYIKILLGVCVCVLALCYISQNLRDMFFL